MVGAAAYLLAMLISPACTIVVILLLHTPKGALTAFAFVWAWLVDDGAGHPIWLSIIICWVDHG